MGTKIQCLECHDIIEGDRRGTCISCSCGKCYIDETPDYYRIGGDPGKIALVDENGNITHLLQNDIKKASEEPKRIDKINYYLNIAESISQRSTCLKSQYGAIIVQNDEIISTGYNGAPRGMKSCLDRKECLRKNSKRGTNYENCVSVHAEMNAIIQAERSKMIGSTLYLVGKDSTTKDYKDNPEPCCMCKRLIINAGISHVIVRTGENAYRDFDVSYWNEEDIIGG